MRLLCIHCCCVRMRVRVRLQEALEGIVVFLALSQYDNEVSDLLHRFKAETKLDELPAYKCVEQRHYLSSLRTHLRVLIDQRLLCLTHVTCAALAFGWLSHRRSAGAWSTC